MKKEDFLNKKNSAALHGIAILMMIYHHLFIAGNKWAINEGRSLLDLFNRINFFGAETAQMNFAWFCKLCVAIFAFSSGYAIYRQLDDKCQGEIKVGTMFRYCLKRFFNFYLKYLLCFLFFISCEYFMGNQNHFDFSLANYLLNLAGIRATFNGTWWYILVYYYMIIAAPFFYAILKKINKKGYLCCLGAFVLSFLIALISGNFLPYLKELSFIIQHYQLIYLLIFAEGMFCARYGILDYLGLRMNLFSSVILLIGVYLLRVLLIRAPSDPLFDLVLIVPFVLSVTKIISYSETLNRFLGFIGRYSAYMWYSHAYFYSYLFFSLVFRCDLSLIVYLQVVAYSLLSALAFSFLEKKLRKLISATFLNKPGN